MSLTQKRARGRDKQYARPFSLIRFKPGLEAETLLERRSLHRSACTVVAECRRRPRYLRYDSAAERSPRSQGGDLGMPNPTPPRPALPHRARGVRNLLCEIFPEVRKDAVIYQPWIFAFGVQQTATRIRWSGWLVQREGGERLPHPLLGEGGGQVNRPHPQQGGG